MAVSDTLNDIEEVGQLLSAAFSGSTNPTAQKINAAIPVVTQLAQAGASANNGFVWAAVAISLFHVFFPPPVATAPATPSPAPYVDPAAPR